MILKFLIDLIARFGQLLTNAGWPLGLVRLTTTLAVLCCVALFVWGLYWLVRVVLSKIVRAIANKYQNRIGDILVGRHVIRHTSYLLICIIFNTAIPSIFAEFPAWIAPLQKLLAIATLWFVVRILTGLLWCIVDYQAVRQQNKQRSFKGLVQFANIIVYFLGAIILLSILLNKSPLVFIGGLGAASAVLMLIFKDSILGLVAGVQLSYNDIVRIGDWITMSKFNADGTVVDITLTTVKVQNFDLTITTIPAYNLISDSVVNWRSMSDSKHRRIQRAINIDITGIRFCEPAFLTHLAQEEALAAFMSPYMPLQGRTAASAGADAAETASGADADAPIPLAPDAVRLPHGGLTNIYLFRKYIEFYLRHHPNIENAPGYTLMVRQQPMEDYGLPIQIYCFTRTSEWVTYEAVQSDVFDHLLAMAPVFGLAVFERTAQPDTRTDANGLPTIDAPAGSGV